MTKISLYRNVNDKIGTPASLWQVVTSDKWREVVNRVRSEANKERRNKLKKDLLPAFTASGTFKPELRKKEGLIKHSGYICIDIDSEDNPKIIDWPAFVLQLGNLQETAFAGLSVSGNGAFALIPISDPSNHELHFKAIEEDFLSYGIIIDPKCKDVNRLRFCSYNKHPYINKQAKVYTRKYRQRQRLVESTFHSNGTDVEELVNEIIRSGVNIVPNYEAWFNVGASLANVHNGRELFHRISQLDPAKYNRKDCDKQFDKMKPGKGINVNTLFYIAETHGIILKKNVASEPNAVKKKKVISTPKKEPSKKTECYINAAGKLFIPTPASDSTFTVYESVEHYNKRKGLPSFIDVEEVDTTQLSKRYIDLNTLIINLK